MSPDTSRGPKVLGNYELLAKIAEGGMGAVYRGKNRSTGEIVAIKVVPPETAKNQLLLKRFEQEFKAASLIDHPNVVRALDYCGTGPTPFLVMEFVDGESLGQRVERVGAITEVEAVRFISQVCEGLHRAHKQGLIHRDVKPDNILVTADGVAKLTDLGLVKDVEAEQNLTRTGRGLGTPHFMAPEQFRNAKNADVRCDVYSLGATLYALITGTIPFANASPLDCWMKKLKNDFPEPRAVNPAISERTNWAVCRAMGSEPAGRPASCREFMEDLTGVGWRTGGASSANLTPPTAAEDLWYLVYRDEQNELHTVKGTTENVRRHVTAGAVGDVAAILVSRTKAGPFIPLKSAPEFRDLVLGGASGRMSDPALRPVPPPDTATSSGARTPSPPAVASPRPTPAPAPSARPSPAQGTRPTPRPEPVPAPAPVMGRPPSGPASHVPLSAQLAASKRPAEPTGKFDWTAWLLIGIAVAATGLGVLFFMK